MSSRLVLIGVVLGLLVACSRSTGGQGSSGGAGGVTSSGGVDGSGGTTGGSTAEGGALGTGGTSGTGGSSAEGGASATGGVSAEGGIVGIGGSAGEGGATGTAGGSGTRTASGGALGTGGGIGRGGTTGRGGATGAGGSTSTGTCTREMLQAAVDAYLAAMATGDPSSLPLAASATYTENGTKSQFGDGVWTTPLVPDLTMNLLDVDKCGSYTEVIAANADHPYVLGVRLTVSNGQISAAYVIATDCDDWGFNAANYLKYAKAEQDNTAEGSGWGLVPEDDRYTRDELLAGGDAYFAYWGNKDVEVPWGYPCSRLEGGMATNPDPRANANSTCSVGVPDQSMAPRPNDHLTDVDYGMVVVFVGLPGPDSHWFRFTKSTDMRYIHTLTICYVNGAWQCPGSAPVCK